MLHLISMLQDPFENFTGVKFVFFHRSIARMYWGGGVAGATEEIIRETCKYLDIEIIDMTMNEDPVHLFIKKIEKHLYN